MNIINNYRGFSYPDHRGIPQLEKDEVKDIFLIGKIRCVGKLEEVFMPNVLRNETQGRYDDRYRQTQFDPYGRNPYYRYDRDYQRDVQQERRHNRQQRSDVYDDNRDYGEPQDWDYVEEYYWYIPGPYTGYGPNNYQRSDERILDDIVDRLTQHGQIDATNLTISVDQGEVTLSGDVQSRWAKRMAEDVADSVPGVRDVNNQIHIQNRPQTDRNY